MFKFVRYGLAIASLMLPLFAQAELTGIKEFDLCGKNSLKTCDFTIISPSFASSFCNGQTQLGLYTVRNNTPVSVLMQRIEIVQNDALLAAQTAILTAPVNNCNAGTSLAPGATCNILVNVSALAVSGTFNRIVRVYINTRQVKVDSLPITSTVSGVACPIGTPSVLPPEPPLPVIPPVIPPPPPPAPVPAGICPLDEFAILAAAEVTNTGGSFITGDVGVSPGSAITGFPPGEISGTFHAADGVAAAAQAQALVRYNDLKGRPCDVNLTGQDLGGLVLSPGVYCFDSSAQLTGTLTLNALGSTSGTFIFQIDSTLTTASNSAVVLINGAAFNNVNWQVGSSATLGIETAFQGNIYALASITMTTGATFQGRAVALNGAITLDTNAVNRQDGC